MCQWCWDSTKYVGLKSTLLFWRHIETHSVAIYYLVFMFSRPERKILTRSWMRRRCKSHKINCHIKLFTHFFAQTNLGLRYAIGQFRDCRVNCDLCLNLSAPKVCNPTDCQSYCILVQHLVTESQHNVVKFWRYLVCSTWFLGLSNFINEISKLCAVFVQNLNPANPRLFTVAAMDSPNGSTQPINEAHTISPKAFD